MRSLKRKSESYWSVSEVVLRGAPLYLLAETLSTSVRPGRYSAPSLRGHVGRMHEVAGPQSGRGAVSSLNERVTAITDPLLDKLKAIESVLASSLDLIGVERPDTLGRIRRHARELQRALVPVPATQALKTSCWCFERHRLDHPGHVRMRGVCYHHDRKDRRPPTV